MTDNWNRCDFCGLFIAIKEFKDETAVRFLLTPDTAFTVESYETYHVACDEKGLKQK